MYACFVAVPTRSVQARMTTVRRQRRLLSRALEGIMRFFLDLPEGICDICAQQTSYRRIDPSLCRSLRSLFGQSEPANVALARPYMRSTSQSNFLVFHICPKSSQWFKQRNTSMLPGIDPSRVAGPVRKSGFNAMNPGQHAQGAPQGV